MRLHRFVSSHLQMEVHLAQQTWLLMVSPSYLARLQVVPPVIKGILHLGLQVINAMGHLPLGCKISMALQACICKCSRVNNMRYSNA